MYTVQEAQSFDEILLHNHLMKSYLIHRSLIVNFIFFNNTSALFN